MGSKLNPYETTDLPENSDQHRSTTGDWMVRDGVLLCGSTVVLPEICYETLETNDLVPYDLKLKGPATIFSTIWVGAVVVLFFASRLSSFSLRIGAALLLLLFFADKLAQKWIRLRMFESQEIRTSRRSRTVRSCVIRGSCLIVGVVVYFGFLSGSVSSDVKYVSLFLLIMGGIVLPDFLLKVQKAPEFTVIESDVDMFVVAGPSHQYLTALASHRGDSWDRLVSG